MTGLTSSTNSKRMKIQPDGFFGVLVFLCTGLIFSLYFSPSLYYDDWNHLAYNYYTNNLPWFMTNFIRPLSYTPLRLETTLFGLNLPVMTGIHILLLCIESLLFFFLLQKLKLFPVVLNCLAALLIIFSPMDMTRMWLLISPLMMIMVLIYMICLVEFTEKRKGWLLGVGTFVGFVTLLYYEVQLGLLIIFPVFLFLLMRSRHKTNYWWLWMPVAFGGIYLAFRALGLAFGTAKFHESQSITIIYLLRQIRNAILSLFNAWYIPIREDLTIGLASVWTAIIGLIFLGFHYTRHGFESNVSILLRKTGILLGTGILVWLAGYIPWIVYGIPSDLNWFSSRAHNTAIPGAILSLIAFVYFLASITRVSLARKQIIMAVLALPFLLIGVLTHTAIQRENSILWNEYRSMWKGIFKEVPGIRDGAHVVLVITPNPTKPRFGEREFLTSASFNVEISRALAIFYGKDTLEGEFMYRSMELADTPTLHEHGIRNPPTYSGLIPYGEILFIEYDRVSRRSKVVTNLMEEFGIFDPAYNADKFLEKQPPEKPNLRYILGD